MEISSGNDSKEHVDGLGISSSSAIGLDLVHGNSHNSSSGKSASNEGPLFENDQDTEKVLKLSSSKIHDLTSSPESLPPLGASQTGQPQLLRPKSSRAATSPVIKRKHASTIAGGSQATSGFSRPSRIVPAPLELSNPPSSFAGNSRGPLSPPPEPSPVPPTIPLPPLSIPTYLQLELSPSRPSPLYIHRSTAREFPYESSQVKYERLQNFLLLAPNLEGVLWFGTLACLDAWLYSFTILPLRFFKALSILAQWWAEIVGREARYVFWFIYLGTGRMWRRRQERMSSATPRPSLAPPSTASSSRRPSVVDISSPASQLSPSVNTVTPNPNPSQDHSAPERKKSKHSSRRHPRVRLKPSLLLPSHKADLLKGLVVMISCIILTRFDASRMYHSIRGQAAIKLYVIYNVLEVCDRLFSALGQDIFECLFSRETLERKPNGRSKLLRPFGMFLLALTYNVIHSTALFYQVITLNVAVNSYSNALITLLMSNQFVEIKSTVFKRFEKENLFQLTCADVVERFQLWLMLVIIALRNLVEVGLPVISLSFGGVSNSGDSANYAANVTASLRAGILPKSFTLFPRWTGQLFSPFFLVLGSEMIIDWLKHAYITKFNNTKPAIYGRFLDVLAKDYYSNAFADQNLTRRLGLPVIPLSCLFIRSSLQTYHMFLANHMPSPLPSSATSLSEASTTSPATTAALEHVDAIIRRALGRSSFGAGGVSSAGSRWWWSGDDVIALITLIVVFAIVFFVLLAFKLVLGMLLLNFSQRRYKSMKERERDWSGTSAKSSGGWGVVEVDDDKKRWIYQDDPAGAKAARERDKAARDRESRSEADFGGVSRYTMHAKRIW